MQMRIFNGRCPQFQIANPTGHNLWNLGLRHRFFILFDPDLGSKMHYRRLFFGRWSGTVLKWIIFGQPKRHKAAAIDISVCQMPA
jgi:hypothetical protein